MTKETAVSYQFLCAMFVLDTWNSYLPEDGHLLAITLACSFFDNYRKILCSYCLQIFVADCRYLLTDWCWGHNPGFSSAVDLCPRGGWHRVNVVLLQH